MNREWNSSGVMNEFIKIAAESGLITSDLQQKELAGNADKDTPVKDHRRYEPTEEYELDVEGGNLVGKAHPKPAWMADKSTPVKSMGNGSLVENVEEQQKKDIEVATRMPSGALFGIHASVVSELVKLANKLDDEGRYEESTRIDQTIERLGRLPFVVSHLRKTAWIWPVVTLISAFAPSVIEYFKRSKTVTKGPGGTVKTRGAGKALSRGGKIFTGVSLGLSALSIFGDKLTSVQEGIKKDTKDLYEILKKAEAESAAAGMAAKKLLPYVKAFEVRPQDAAGYEVLNNKAKELKSILPAIKVDINNALTDIGKSWYSWTGLDLHSRLIAKLDTFEDSLEQVKSLGNRVNTLAAAGLGQESLSGVAGLQQVLVAEGLLAEATNSLDYETVQAVSKLENSLDRDINELYERKIISKRPASGFKGKILKDGQISMNPEKLNRIISLIKRLKTAKGK